LRGAQVFREYFKELEEESIRDNFVIIYELFDEIMDFGYPQTTETKILQEYALLASGIASCSWLWTRRDKTLTMLSLSRSPGPTCRYITQESHKLMVEQSKPPMAVTNAVSWRSEGIKYRKNEVFLDVIESVNLLVCLGERRTRGGGAAHRVHLHRHYVRVSSSCRVDDIVT
jgi:AP-1 complex subunit mu